MAEKLVRGVKLSKQTMRHAADQGFRVFEENKRAIDLYRRLTMEKPQEPFTEVSAVDYAAAVVWLPPANRRVSEKISDLGYQNILFAGHWIVPKGQ